MRQELVEAGLCRIVFFDSFHEPVQALEAVQFIGVSNPGAVERAAQDRYRFIVSLERDRKRMTVFAAQSERKAGRVLKTRRSAMHYFRNERERFVACAGRDSPAKEEMRSREIRGRRRPLAPRPAA